MLKSRPRELSVTREQGHVLGMKYWVLVQVILLFLICILEGSFSAAWTATIAKVGAFFSIFRALQDLHSFAPLQFQNLNKISWNFFGFLLKILQTFAIFPTFFIELCTDFDQNFTEVRRIFDIPKNDEQSQKCWISNGL